MKCRAKEYLYVLCNVTDADPYPLYAPIRIKNRIPINLIHHVGESRKRLPHRPDDLPNIRSNLPNDHGHFDEV